MSALLYCLISIIEKLKICEDHLFHFYISVAKIVISSFQPLKENRFVIPKSRYDSISTYLSPEGNKYSDIDLVHDKEIYQQLVDAGLFLFYLITCTLSESLLISAGDFSQYCNVLKHNIDKVVIE